MPTRKVSKKCYRWGKGKTYCGKGAKKKANKQKAAAYANGYKGK